MTRFKDALLDELVAHARLSTPTARPARPRRVKAIRLSLAGAASAVGVTVAASVVGLTGPQAAYAVEKNHDGTVTITFRELADPEKATRDLRAAGVPAQVVWLAWPGSCATTSKGVPVPVGAAMAMSLQMPDEYPYQGDEREWMPTQSGTRLTVNPSAIPAGAELFILERPNPSFGVGTRLVKAPAPACWEAESVSIWDTSGKMHVSPSQPLPAIPKHASPSPSGSPEGPHPSRTYVPSPTYYPAPSEPFPSPRN
jgi:hypothetical protein